MITVESDVVDLSTDELIETISDLYLFYTDGTEVPSEDEIVNSDS